MNIFKTILTLSFLLVLSGCGVKGPIIFL
ncbi:MAG: lipoprotein [Gammaproteobacteria bacterium]